MICFIKSLRSVCGFGYCRISDHLIIYLNFFLFIRLIRHPPFMMGTHSCCQQGAIPTHKGTPFRYDSIEWEECLPFPITNIKFAISLPWFWKSVFPIRKVVAKDNDDFIFPESKTHMLFIRYIFYLPNRNFAYTYKHMKGRHRGNVNPIYFTWSVWAVFFGLQVKSVTKKERVLNGLVGLRVYKFDLCIFLFIHWSNWI